MEIDAKLNQICAAAATVGGRAYLVGGCVRDSFMGRDSKDRDILVTGVPADVLKSVLPGRVELVGQAFGVFKVTVEGETFDVALPRKERSTGAGHKDFEVMVDPGLSVEADLSRRDFTMNAIAVNLATSEIIDPFDGRLDIENQLIRCVGDAEERFREDPLRMLRAFQFQSRFGYQITSETFGAIEKCACLIPTVAAERIHEEMDKLLSGRALNLVVDEMIHAGVLARVLPEFMPSVGMKQHNPHHFGTVAAHVQHALSEAVANKASLRARWAILLHDIGKPHTFTIGQDGYGHFYGHEDVGADIADKVLDRMKFSVEDRTAIVKLVREHLRPELDCSDRALRRWVAGMGDLVEDALMVRRCDLAAHVDGDVRVMWMDEIQARIPELGQIRGFTEAQLALRGDEIAKTFEVTGSGIGDLKRAAAQAVIDGEIANEPEAIRQYLKTVWGNRNDRR